MLILTRRPVETIYIGENVTVTVLGVVGNQVRLGISAPKNITIDREEIRDRKRAGWVPGQKSADGNVAERRAPGVDGNTSVVWTAEGPGAGTVR